MGYWVAPGVLEALNGLRNALARGETITCYCFCCVDYKGRAVSRLEWGERVVLIKQDKTLLIHQVTGRNPVNWMSGVPSIKFDVVNDELVLTAESINPREHMIVTINGVKFLFSDELRDGYSQELVGTEADMSQMLYDNPGLVSDDFIPVSLEEQTRYGFIDVMGHDGKGNLVLIECKRYKADFNTVQQLRRYVERVSKDKGVGVDKIRGIVAAPEITGNAEGMLKDWGFSFVKVEPPMSNVIDKSRQKSLMDF